MSAPISFPSVSSIHGLPLLFAGQAQKEISINQSLMLLDVLLQKSIDGSTDSPPEEPSEGSVYRVLASASDQWAGQENNIAIFLGGTWNFITPYVGLSLYDRGAGKLVRFDSEWHSSTEPNEPLGGSVVDVEARLAITQIIEVLRSLGHLVQIDT